MSILLHRTSQLILAFALVCVTPAFGQAPSDALSEARQALSGGRINDSEVILREYLKDNPSSADAHFLLGYALFRDQQAEKSLAEFTEGAKYRRPKADELKIVASDYVLLNDFGDADKWFSQVVSETPGDAVAWYLLGRTKYNEGEYAGGISSFERALSLRPRYVEAENNIGLSWKELNSPDKAQSAFKTAIEWQGATPVDAQPFLNLGTLLAEANKVEEAISYLTTAASLSPQNPTVHEQLGKAYLAQKKFQPAQVELERAIELAPKISSLHYKLAQIYRKEGMEDRAKLEFEICERLNGNRSSPKTPNRLSSDPALEPPSKP